MTVPYPSRDESKIFSCACGAYTEEVEWGSFQWSIDQAVAHLERASGAEAIQIVRGTGDVDLYEGRSL